MEHRLLYPSDIHQIPSIRKDLGHLEDTWKIPKSKMRQLRLMVEELFSNIVRFAYEDPTGRKVEIILEKTEGAIRIEIIDDGIPFNPVEYVRDAQNHPVGVESEGMGLTLVHTFANKLTYKRKDNKNHLIIQKKL